MITPRVYCCYYRIALSCRFHVVLIFASFKCCWAPYQQAHFQETWFRCVSGIRTGSGTGLTIYVTQKWQPQWTYHCPTRIFKPASCWFYHGYENEFFLPLLCFRIHGHMRSTHSHPQGVACTCLAGRWSYFLFFSDKHSSLLYPTYFFI
jgi:hypothetical protein